MKNRLLIYAIMASVAVHVFVLVLVGRTSVAKPIQVDQLKVVRVDLVKAPEDVSLAPDKPDTPKPAKIDVPYVPPVSKMVEDKHPPKPAPVVRTAVQPRSFASTPGPQPRVPAATVPGNPGGRLNMGTINRGQDLGHVPDGRTVVGSVPSSVGGQGSGSGTGLGVGSPEPNPRAVDGPGTRTAPAVVTPPPPPQPRYVEVTVCAASGMLPGRYCERKETKSFREGTEPRSICDRCKAPEPVHVNRLADRSEPELIKDAKVDPPELDEGGNYTVVVHYIVNSDGGIGDIEITESSGVKSIDRAVREAVSKLRYKPAVQNGEPRSVRIKRKYRISL